MTRQPFEPTEVTGEEIAQAFRDDRSKPRQAGMVKAMEDAAMAMPALAPPRDEVEVLAKLKRLAQAAGDDWYYRFPVKRRFKTETGAWSFAQDWIEGPSIKCANNVARIYGNCLAQARPIYETDEAWVFAARFIDRETGFLLERAFQQRKSQKTMGSDEARSLDIAFQIGQSKAIRNVICNALEQFADYAFQEAKQSLVERIGKNLDKSRAWIIEQVAKRGVELIRVERSHGRKATEWLAPDMALIYAELQSVNDGMAMPSELWPVTEPAVDKPGAAAQQEPAAKAEEPVKATPSKTEKEAQGTPSGAEPLPKAAKAEKKSQAPAAAKPKAENREDDQPVDGASEAAANAARSAAAQRDDLEPPAELDRRPKPPPAAEALPPEDEPGPQAVPYRVGAPEGKAQTPRGWLMNGLLPELRRMRTVEQVKALLAIPYNEKYLKFCGMQDAGAVADFDRLKIEYINSLPPPGAS